MPAIPAQNTLMAIAFTHMTTNTIYIHYTVITRKHNHDILTTGLMTRRNSQAPDILQTLIATRTTKGTCNGI